MKRLCVLSVLALLFLAFTATSIKGANLRDNVLIVNVESEITLDTEIMIKDALDLADSREARLVIVTLNTPGGEVTSVQNIMNLFEESEIPICVFVYPTGATAWSGGTYLLVASHIAAMASGTTIGSCQPVLPTGQSIEYSKYINAYSNLMVNHAKLHSRNETAARLFVTDNLNLGPEKAKVYNVVELIADSILSVLEKLEGYTLIQSETPTGTLVWKLVPNSEVKNFSFVKKETFENLSASETEKFQPGLQVMLLGFLLNPIVSSLLLIIGIFVFFIGIKTPGYGAEIAGGIMIFLGLIAFGVIGITPAAIIFLVIGTAVILAELKTHIGVLAMSGAFCIILASLLLFPSPQWLIYQQVSQQIQKFLVGVATILAVLFAFIVYKVAEAKRRQVMTGAEPLIGAQGIAVTDLKPKGQIRVLSEFWRAKTENEWITKGQKVEVVGRDGLVLVVRPMKEKV